MTARLLACAVLLLCLGCTGPSLSTRSVRSDGSLSVRLDTYRDAARAAEVRLDHPVDLSELDLRSILGRLFLQEQVGLLQKAPPPVAVFSPVEVAGLAPALRQAFQMARPSEWVVFVMRSSDRTGLTMTSGGFFVREGRLHVLLANHRDSVARGPDTEAVEANPLRPLMQRGRALTFDGRAYLVAEQESWMGGRGYPPSSELVLDYQAFLAASRPPAGLARPAPAATVAEPVEGRDAVETAELRKQVRTLQDRVDRLERQLEEQAAEITRLKAQAAEAGGPKKKPGPKKPAPKHTP